MSHPQTLFPAGRLAALVPAIYWGKWTELRGRHALDSYRLVDAVCGWSTYLNIPDWVQGKRAVQKACRENQKALQLLARRCEVLDRKLVRGVAAQEVVRHGDVTMFDCRMVLAGNPFALLRHGCRLEDLLHDALPEQLSRYGVACELMRARGHAELCELQAAFAARGLAWETDFMSLDPSMGVVHEHPLHDDLRNLEQNPFEGLHDRDYMERQEYLALLNCFTRVVEVQDLSETTTIYMRGSLYVERELPQCIAELVKAVGPGHVA